ncbi:MAG: glycine rich domain-containing protein, partial [Bacilli bacterium]|nr:glycine rich domain-containing protein [Bacilli bacterium]
FGSPNNNGTGGGGGGYYGGDSGLSFVKPNSSGSGSSSFISGYTGVNAIRVDGTHSGTTKHFSGYVFDNMVMYSGTQTFLSPAGVNETGHTGNGYARISLIDPNQSNTLSKVRYIYNEMNGSTSNQSSHWVELQAYDINGNNVSQGVTTITNNYLGAVDLTRLTNGNVATAEYIEGGIGVSFVMLDLGKEYDLSTIRLWHYYGDGRTYYDNIVKVAGNDELFRVVLDEEYPETSHGKIIRPESID